MIRISIHYKNFLGMPKNLERFIPSKYDEMNEEQFTALIHLSKGWITEEEFLLKFFHISTTTLKRIQPYQLYMLTEHIRSIDPSMACGDFIIKQIGCLHAPEDELADMSFQQFISIDQYFQANIYTEKWNYAVSAIANMYCNRKKDWFADSFSEKQSLLSSRKQQELYPAIINWMLVKNWLAKLYPFVFQSAPTNTADNRPIKPKPGNWIAVLDALVGDNLASMENVKHMDVHDALRVLNNRMKEQNTRKK